MYLNDIEETFILHGVQGIKLGDLKLFLLLYADDIILFAKSAHELQNSLNVLADYCDRWKLTVNVKKTKVMVFQKGGRLPQNLSFKYKSEEIEIVSKFKYLGILFTSGGSFNETDRMLAGQALKAIFKMNKYLFKFTDISPKHTLDLFDKLVAPILNYSNEVWGFNNGSQVERTHLAFCKRLLGVKISTQNDFIYGETGRANLINGRYYTIIKYWLKLCACGDNKYVKHAYNMLKNSLDANPNKTNWVSKVKVLLSQLGFYEAWLNQGVGNTKLFLLLVKQRLRDNFAQNLNATIHESSRSLFYRTIFSFNFSEYLNLVNITKYRNALSRLRLSSHRLAVETGRWHRPESIPYYERKCIKCGVLEDEFHFVLECDNYKDIRKKYINNYYLRHPNFVKFIQLINSVNPVELKNLATFTFKAFEIRRQLVAG